MDESQASLASVTPPPKSIGGSIIPKERQARHFLHEAVPKAFLA